MTIYNWVIPKHVFFCVSDVFSSPRQRAHSWLQNFRCSILIFFANFVFTEILVLSFHRQSKRNTNNYSVYRREYILTTRFIAHKLNSQHQNSKGKKLFLIYCETFEYVNLVLNLNFVLCTYRGTSNNRQSIHESELYTAFEISYQFPMKQWIPFFPFSIVWTFLMFLYFANQLRQSKLNVQNGLIFPAKLYIFAPIEWYDKTRKASNFFFVLPFHGIKLSVKL